MADGFEVVIQEEERGLDKLIASLQIFRASGATLHAGVQFPERTYDNGTTVGLVGMAHEFGTSESRPPTKAKYWLRGTFERNKVKYGTIIAMELGHALDRGRLISPKALFLSLGPTIKKDLKETISGLPLVDTGLLLRSVGFRVSATSASEGGE